MWQKIKRLLLLIMALDYDFIRQVPFLTGMNSVSEIRTMFAAEVHFISLKKVLLKSALLLTSNVRRAAHTQEQDDVFCRRQHNSR